MNGKTFTTNHRGTTADHGQDFGGHPFRFRHCLFWIPVSASIIFSFLFLRGLDSAWSDKNLYLQGMVFCLALATMVHACFSFNIVNAFLLFSVTFIVSVAAETLGIRWPWLFGSLYHYNPDMVPRLPGGVPLCIPLIWFSLVYTAMVFLRLLPVRREGSLVLERVIIKAAWCSLVITAMDFVIDPLGVFFKGWFWHEPGRFFGVPIGNFAGWYLVGLIVNAIYIPLEKPSVKDVGVFLDLQFTAVSVLLTLSCFVGCTIWVGSILPAVLSFTFMGPCWLYWAVRVHQVRRKLPDP